MRNETRRMIFKIHILAHKILWAMHSLIDTKSRDAFADNAAARPKPKLLLSSKLKCNSMNIFPIFDWCIAKNHQCHEKTNFCSHIFGFLHSFRLQFSFSIFFSRHQFFTFLTDFLFRTSNTRLIYIPNATHSIPRWIKKVQCCAIGKTKKDTQRWRERDDKKRRQREKSEHQIAMALPGEK